MAVLKIGSDAGVKQGDAFTLARGKQLVAIVAVVRVLPKMCVVKVRNGELKRPIQLGDVALPLKPPALDDWN